MPVYVLFRSLKTVCCLLPVAAGLQHWTFGTSLLFMTATTVQLQKLKSHKSKMVFIMKSLKIYLQNILKSQKKDTIIHLKNSVEVPCAI